MAYKPWQLMAMEEFGYMDTKYGLINRVARYLSKIPDDIIGEDTFRKACIACGVNPDSFTQEDLVQLHSILKKF